MFFNFILCNFSVPYDIVGRNPDNNFVGFWEKQCFHKIISIFTDLYNIFKEFLDFSFAPQSIKNCSQKLFVIG